MIDSDLVIRPFPGIQERFVSCPAFEAAMGGGRGRGGSFGLVLDQVRHIVHPRFRGIILRRTSQELRELEDICWRIIPAASPKAVFNKTEKVWQIPNGARIELSAMERDDDKRKL